MHDLRHDQEAADAKTHARLRPSRAAVRAVFDAVPCYDTRTEQEKVRDELVRIVDALQGLTLRVEMLEQAQRAPLAMAEDAWGCG